jgi:hypothetical protein
MITSRCRISITSLISSSSSSSCGVKGKSGCACGMGGASLLLSLLKVCNIELSSSALLVYSFISVTSLAILYSS